MTFSPGAERWQRSISTGGATRRHTTSSASRDRTARLPRSARLVESHILTLTGTFRLVFEVVDDEPFDFVPGQFVAIDMNDARHGYRRSPYCLLDGSEHDRHFELLVRRIGVGPVSIFLAQLGVGDIISFRGPTGHSMLAVEDQIDLVMIATGVGLSPCYCLLRQLQILRTERKIKLFWGLRYITDICLTNELDAIAVGNRNFEYSITLSSPTAAWQGLRGRVTESIPPLLDALSDTQFYLVSNGEMIAEMSAALQNLGVARERIYEESFFNHRNHPSADAVRSVEDRFVATDIERPIDRLERELSRFNRTNRRD